MQQLSIFETAEHNRYVKTLFAKRAELTQMADEAKARDDVRAFREYSARRLAFQQAAHFFGFLARLAQTVHRRAQLCLCLG